jgi:transposase-like protein
MRNVLAEVPKKQKGMVGAMLGTIFAAADLEEAKAQLRVVAAQLGPRFPKAAEIILDAEDEARRSLTSRRSAGSRPARQT